MVCFVNGNLYSRKRIDFKLKENMSQKDFWNERYSREEFIYGIAPNEYLKEKLQEIKPGKILFPAEGEGRNAVYAAKMGWKPEAFDQSEAGKEKAISLAEENQTDISYTISDAEKIEVQKIQRSGDGALRCYISGKIIDLENNAIEYDHLQAFVNGGETDTSNIRIFLKEFNREKGKMPLETYKEYFNLKRLYEEKDNKVKLQDILAFKNINRESFHINLNDEQINIIGNNNQNYSYKLFYDPKLEIQYFYAQLPISWLKNDDEQGLQPRVIDFKRLNQLHKHFQSFPQLAPSIARLVNNDIKLFDGQHKLAAQILNNNMFIDIKVYISPKDEIKAKNIYEKLLKTNLEAHSKLAQVSFYTNTLFQKWNEMYSIKWEEYVEMNPNEKHSEYNFFNFLLKKHEKAEVRNMFEASIIKNVHDQSALKKYTAESNKDATFPLSQDLLKKTIFKNAL